jgi:hypothetical protein
MHIQIDQLGSLPHSADSRLLNRFALSNQGDDATIVIMVHLAVEKIDAIHLHGFDDGVNFGFIAAFGEIGDTFNQCGHTQKRIAGRIALLQTNQSEFQIEDFRLKILD